MSNPGGNPFEMLGHYHGRSQHLDRSNVSDEAILESIGDGIVVVDLSGKIVMLNAQAEAILGVRKRDVLGVPYYKAWSVEDEAGNVLPNAQRPFHAALTTGKKITTTSATTAYWHVRTGRGRRRFPSALTITPIRLDGGIVGAVAVFRDATRERTDDQAKSEFVALASHQLRTSPTLINWSTELLMSDIASSLTKKQQALLQEIHHSNQNMIDLINAFLNVSRIESGTVVVDPQPVDLDALVKDIVSHELKLQIAAKHLQMQEEYDRSQCRVLADAKLLRIVLQNLLTNAMKYTPNHGRVTVTVTQVGRRKHPGHQLRSQDHLITVADTGCGIPKDQQPRIFEKLFRAENARTSGVDGSGLGLYIVRSILDYTGGQIWFESRERKGTTFFVTLPYGGMPRKAGKVELITPKG